MWLFTFFFWWAPNPCPFFWPSVLCWGRRTVTLQLKANQPTNAKTVCSSHYTVSELLITSTNCKKWDTVLKKIKIETSLFSALLHRSKKWGNSSRRAITSPVHIQSPRMPCTACSRRKTSRVGIPCGEISFTTGSVLSYAFILGLQKKEK